MKRRFPDLTGLNRMNLKETVKSERIRRLDLSFYVEVQQGALVGEVIEKMQVNNRKCALILDGNSLVGIFTAHDIRDHTGDTGALSKPIESVMTADPETIDGNASLAQAIAFLNTKPYRYLPVMNKEGHVMGTLTHFAILKYISDYFPEDIYNLPPEPDQIATARDGA
jgi:predicted transcriptional regulator